MPVVLSEWHHHAEHRFYLGLFIQQLERKRHSVADLLQFLSDFDTT